MLSASSSGTPFCAWLLLRNLFPLSLLMKKYLRKFACLCNILQVRTARPVCCWKGVGSCLSHRDAMKTNAVEKCYEQVLWFVVVLVLESVLPFQVPGVASLLSICLHTQMLVSFLLCRLSLFHFMLPQFSQLGTENKAEKMFTASHISLKKVSLASSGLFRDFCSKDPANMC